MSEPQLISPLLDGFVMGDPIGAHDGVRSCPAMQLETDKKYIVKIISLPANQAKLDALLLAGAYSDSESALAYFKELADGVLEEAELLKNLSRHEGFVSFEDWQLESMSDGETGYDIYLLSEYLPTLEGIFRSNEMTHLSAINLGLDLCASLSVARRFGYLYGNLKPSNIYVCNEREFCIGDLGFLRLDSLQYASLPEKYHSDYTPPEISDAYSALNDTMDTYAVGLILYQAYNGGQLPPVGYTLEAPRYADYELAQIILKACSINPEERWQDPAQLGQALANYMQSNSVNDTPIVPEATENEEEALPFEEEENDEPSTEDILAEVDEALESAPPIIVAEPVEEQPEVAEAPKVADATPAEEDTEVSEAPVEETAEESTEEIPAETEAEDTSSEEEIAQEPASEEAPEEAPEEATEDILSQADDLIAHQLPDPVVAPEPIEVTLPVVEEPEEAEEDESEDTPSESDEAAVEEPIAEEAASQEEEASQEPEEAQPKKRKGWLKAVIISASILLLLVAGVLFYQYFYLQTINSMVLTDDEGYLSVALDTDIADDKLTVKCSDTHGNSLTQQVEDGVATFEGLKPGTTYKLEVRISGFHKLLGQTTQIYTTATQTTIGGFYAVTGPEDGSVILSFTVQGPDSAQWSVRYSAEDEEEQSLIFNGHLVTLNGLTVGKEYTFTISPVTNLYLSGTDTITYVPQTIIYAQDLQIQGYADNKLTLTWVTPEGITVPTWYIRCYNEQYYDKTLTTSGNTIAFEGLDLSQGYTIEVTAEGMTLGSRVYLSANSVSIENVKADASDRNNLHVTWDFSGTAPEGGWLLLYTLDGSDDQQVVKCKENSGTITPLIPGGKYSISIQPADGGTAFGGTLEYDAPQAPVFSGYQVNADNIELTMCETPDVKNWDRHDVKNYTNTFATGVSASFVMHLTQKTDKSKDDVVALYVIRDAKGNIVSSKYESRTWDDMWYNRYGKLTIPVMPEKAGNYTVSIYFDGTAVSVESFKIVKA